MGAASEGADPVSSRRPRRSTRSGSGQVWFSERDGRLLELVGEQYAVSVPQLAWLIGRTQHAGRWLRDRWRRAGWIESRPLTYGGPSFVWIPSHGARIAPSPYRHVGPHGG